MPVTTHPATRARPGEGDERDDFFQPRPGWLRERVGANWVVDIGPPIAHSALEGGLTAPRTGTCCTGGIRAEKVLMAPLPDGDGRLIG